MTFISTPLIRYSVGFGMLLALNACANLATQLPPPAASVGITPPPPPPAPIAAPEPPPVLETQPIETTVIEPSVALSPAPNQKSYTLSTASRALVNQATTQRRSKNFVQAAATLERALRIEPKNPLLWLEYGALRMDEHNYPQAESMGRKALASATGDPHTQSSAWRLIADSYKARNQTALAEQAYSRANTLSPP